MFNFRVDDILQTINMIKMHHLDIRTVTLSLSLRDCISTDIKETSEKVYEKITRYAKNLSSYGGVRQKRGCACDFAFRRRIRF